MSGLVWVLLIAVAGAWVPQASQFYLDRIEILDTGDVPFRPTNFDAGPADGDILNNHFFPGVNQYAGGDYSRARVELTYVIDRPYFIEDNPRQKEFMSTSHYLRGMIYAYHAKGTGRYGLAKEDFEAAVVWNSGNYQSYLELSRLYSTLGFELEARSILERLLDLEPDEETRTDARRELADLSGEQQEQENLEEFEN